MSLATVYLTPLQSILLTLGVIAFIALCVYLSNIRRVRAQAKHIKKVNDRLKYLEQKEQEKQYKKEQRKINRNTSKQEE